MLLDLMHAHKFCCKVVSGVKIAIFSVGNSSSVLVDNRKKDMVVLVKNQQMD